MRKLRVAPLAILLLLGVLSTQLLAADPPFTGVINADNVNVRANAGDNYYVVMQLDQGTIVQVREEMFGWYQIVPPEDAFSYISMAFVNRSGDGSRGVVNGNQVRVRAPSPAGPSRSYRTQVTLNEGDTVTILGEEDGYYRIKPPEGSDLSVAAEYVDEATDAQIAAARGEEPDPEPEPEPEEEADSDDDADADDEAESESDSESDSESESEESEQEDDEDRDSDGDEDEGEADDESDEEEAEPEPEPLVSRIAVRADGSVVYEGEVVEGDALTAQLAALVEEFDTLTVYISPEANYTAVSAALDGAREAGFDNVRTEVGEPPVADADEGDDEAPAEDEGDEASAEADDSEPVVLEQDVDVAANEEDAQADGEDEEELDEPLTFSELERRYQQISQMPLRDQPIGELRMDYEHLRVTGELTDAQRRLADARIEILSMRHELQASLLEIAAVEEETQEADVRRAEEDAARPKQYAAVGRLSTSTLYTGDKLPLLYRVVDPATGRTVAYVQPSQGVDPVNLIGNYVGVEGRRDFNGTLGLYVITAESIDRLSADDARRQ